MCGKRRPTIHIHLVTMATKQERLLFECSYIAPTVTNRAGTVVGRSKLKLSTIYDKTMAKGVPYSPCQLKIV